MLSFRGDGQEQEEVRKLLNSLQNSMETLTNVTYAMDNAQHEEADEISRQIVNLNNSFTVSFNELGKFVEEGFVSLRERSENLEARLHEQEKHAEIQAARFNQHLNTLESTLLARLEHLDDWKRTLPPDEIENEAAWLDHIKADLSRLGHSQQLRGNAHLFAVQLVKHLRELQKWSDDIASRDTPYFVEKTTVQQLDRTLFRPHFGVQWIDIGDEEYGEAGMKSRARAELRALETAVLNYRRRLQGQLKQRHNFAPIAIVIHQTIFDPALHETTEMYSMPTNERARDNRIIGVERNGYQCGGEVLERALVRRYLWDESALFEKAGEDAAEQSAASEDDFGEDDVSAGASDEERERLANEAMNK